MRYVEVVLPLPGRTDQRDQLAGRGVEVDVPQRERLDGGRDGAPSASASAASAATSSWAAATG